ncbi:unnamed protein product [Ceutorhynchus assimilis]|uniref:Uncharacterized protein n=1 Tax=Ceutorhynchus assimilis TaxID=467358 RepID=A0A9N9MYV6_9CUCU|nr:unnamed protein product [Ceutorhynchus assimilis]
MATKKTTIGAATDIAKTKLCQLTKYIRVFVRTYENTFQESCPNNEEGLSFDSQEEYENGIVELCFECAKPVYPLDRLEKIDLHKTIEENEKPTYSEWFCIECENEMVTFVKPDECEFCIDNKV